MLIFRREDLFVTIPLGFLWKPFLDSFSRLTPGLSRNKWARSGAIPGPRFFLVFFFFWLRGGSLGCYCLYNNVIVGVVVVVNLVGNLAGFFLTHRIKAEHFWGKYRNIFRGNCRSSKKISRAEFTLQTCHLNFLASLAAQKSIATA